MISIIEHSTYCNVGCGQTPTPGWRNFDNSASLLLARVPNSAWVLFRLGLIDASQFKFIEFARKNHLEFGNAARGLPFKSGSVDVLYSSHMFEHLDHEEAIAFLREARRVLRSGAIMRLAVPDISKQVERYLSSGDADEFVANTHLTQARPQGLVARLKVAFLGTRHHQWMYDGASLSKLLAAHGFRNITVQLPGETMIKNPGSLDLKERADESVYVEATS